MYAIEVKDLKKTYKNGNKEFKAVNSISFNVKEGEIFGFLGPNGAGKSTTINILAGLLTKDSGEILYFGKELNNDNWEEIRNKMNVSTAYYDLTDILTIRQNLRIYAKLYNIKNVEEKINELLELFELTRFADKKIQDLSSGEKTRTALCKGLINTPKLLFLDECTVGLDPDIAEKTRIAIKEYQEKTKCTIIFTSHYMFEVEELCHRIAFVENGKIIEIDTAENLKNKIKKQTIEITARDDVKELVLLIEKNDIKIVNKQNNTVLFAIENDENKIYKLLHQIFENKIMLSNIHIKKPTLDDIFIKIARRK